MLTLHNAGGERETKLQTTLNDRVWESGLPGWSDAQVKLALQVFIVVVVFIDVDVIVVVDPPDAQVKLAL